MTEHMHAQTLTLFVTEAVDYGPLSVDFFATKNWNYSTNPILSDFKFYRFTHIYTCIFVKKVSGVFCFMIFINFSFLLIVCITVYTT